jgi:hypothetical protein
MSSWAAISLVMAAAWFAADRAFQAVVRERERDLTVSKLVEARTLMARHPELFKEENPSPAGLVPLKPLLQEAGTKHGLLVGFLSESEKDAGKGRRECQVSARLVRAPHAKLVHFLADLEGRGSGALVKEIHLRPSKEVSDIYEEAEIVYARAVMVPEAGKKP